VKVLGIILFLSTAAATQQAGRNAVDVFRAMAPAVIRSTFPQANSVAATQAATPQVFKHVDAGIEFELPAGWTAKPDGDVLTIATPDSSVQVVLWAIESLTGDDALKSLRPTLDQTIKNQKITKPAKKYILNEMPVITESGTGEVDGTTIEWTVDLITAKKPIIFLIFAAPQFVDKHADEVAKFRRSIKKLT
jgi:hypothetical protein